MMAPNTQVFLQIGKPTHFRSSNKNVSACGVVGPTYAAYDGRQVDCLACRRTRAWRAYVVLNETGPATCGTCRGCGRLRGKGIYVRGTVVPCPICKGTGKSPNASALPRREEGQL